jgi:peptidoglycan biosynthesis protein MviN/MurJ (putative lipid II flippase)
MAFGGMNYLAIILAAIGGLSMILPWGYSHKKGRMPAAILAASAIAALVMAVVLAGLIGHLGVGQATLRNGVISGLFVWTGFVATTLAVNYLNHGIGWKTALVDGAYWLAALILMGAVIGALGAS